MRNILALLLSLLTCAQPSQKDSVQIEQHRRDVFQGAFNTKGEIRVGRKIQVYFTIRPTIDVPQAEISISLSEGLKLSSGRAHWKQNLRANIETSHSFTIQIIALGESEIQAFLRHPTYEAFNRGYNLYIVADSTGGYTSQTRSQNKLPVTPEQRLRKRR